MVIVDSAKAITNKALPAIRGLIGYNDIGFEEFRGSKHAIIYRLCGNACTSAVSKDETIYVAPIAADQNDRYWLGVSFFFDWSKDKPNKLELKAISLKIFAGTALDVRKTLLFRAEWDNYDDNNHAQPHWHVDSYSLSDDLQFNPPTADDIANFGEETAEPKIEELPLKKLHFAMVTNWQRDRNSSCAHKVTSVDEVTNWLYGCISYIRNQFAYMNKRIG